MGRSEIIYKELSASLISIIKQAGNILRKERNSLHTYSEKGQDNFVTKIDYTVQDFLICKLQSLIPDAKIISEEGQAQADISRNGLVWVIDPIDGTTNFIHNYPHYSISIALIEDGNVVIGLIYNPINQELFHAIKNNGAFLNNNRITVSRSAFLAESLVGFGFPYDKDKTNEMSDLIKTIVVKIQDVRRSGSSALDLAYVACGRLDGFFEFDLEVWDYAAASLMISEAGGQISNWSNKPLSLIKDNVLATNGIIQDQLCKEIQHKTM